MKIYFSSSVTDSAGFAELALKKYDGTGGILAHREDGSPFFSGRDIKVSISHSRGVIAAAFSDKELGLDIEKITDRDWRKIACRYFTEEEKEMLADGDTQKFYDMWTAKEAWTKYLRLSLIDTISRTPEGVVITNIPLIDGYSCSICTAEETEYEIEEI